MSGKGSVKYICEWCGNDFYGCPSRSKSKHICCSKICMSNLRKKLTKEKHLPNAIYPVCENDFYCKPSQLRRYNQVCCCNECANVLKRERMMGTKNHQYGLIGKLNPTWKTDEKITNYGYRKIRVSDHPFRDIDGFVFEHRLIAEKYLLTKENRIEVNGKYYLNPIYVVHHIDGDKLNNDVSNLMVLTKEEHSKLHALKSTINRNPDTGRFECSSGV